MTVAAQPSDVHRPGDHPPPLAIAKLAPPVLRPEVIDRSRITRSLDAGHRSLALVIAPAGYGKTIAVRAWCADRGVPVAWVTLDPADNDPVRLWAYVATAVDGVREGLGRTALQRLRIPGASIEVAVDELMNGLTTFGQEVVVVLDELETVTDPACLASIDHAVERLPANVRLVLVARSDPPLRIARRRVRQALVELRADELAFTPHEMRAFFEHRTDLGLGDAELELLHARTEGWPAALELSAQWLRRSPDPDRTVQSFTGDRAFVADFLSQEALASFDGQLRSFLLQASILGRFTAGLCDSVLERSDSAAVLSGLERSNLFVARLERGGWYRVHPLFAEYAAFRLAEEEGPGAAASLHRRAAHWLAANGLPLDAVREAAAAGDLELVASLLVEHHLALIRGGEARTLLHWTGTLAEELLLDHPTLAATGATAAAMLGERTVECRRLLAIADQAARERSERESQYVSAITAMVRASIVDGSVEEAVENGRRAVELARVDAGEILVAALAGHARALYFAGDLDAAWVTALEAIEHPAAARRAPGHAFARSTLALVAADRGHLSSARTHAEKARSILGGVGANRSWLGANALAAVGLVRLAEGKPAEAERELASAERLFRDEVATVHHTWVLLLQSRIRCRRGRLDGAETVLGAARHQLAELADTGSLSRLVATAEEELAAARGRVSRGEVGEPPSAAELAVLRLLETDLTSRQIGAELHLSPNTVRTHTRALYRKLGVNAREDAVARAGALGLLPDPDSPG